MSTASPEKTIDTDPELDVLDEKALWNCKGPWRCPSCRSPVRYEQSPAGLRCTACATVLPIDNDVLIVKDQTSDNNQVAQGFYDSPLWPKFRFWEWFTWVCNGGERRARNRVLRHLPTTPGLNLLDVAIGDGVYLDWLPRDWRIIGVDISRSQLRPAVAARPAGRCGSPSAKPKICRLRAASSTRSSAIGAFNYFNDPEGSLREMVRVARRAPDRRLRRAAQLD